MAVAKTSAKEALRGDDAPLPRGKFRTRSGEILSFRSTDGSQYDIPEDLKEDGWTYQWQAHTVYNEPSNDLSQMYANGWRYVTSKSRVGQFFLLPGENVDCIVRGGLVLMERPAELTAMYIEETDAKTRFQYQTLMDKSSDLVVPDGFDRRGKQVKRERRLVRASKVAEELAEDGIPDED
jgi:hypothetical protein